MQDIGHESLETHVLDTSNVLGTLEVLARPVFASFPGIVHEVLGHFTQRTTFLAEVDDNATAASLRFLDRFLDTKSEVGSACADVGPEHVTSVALVVDAESELGVWIRHLCWVAEDVDGQTANRRQEELDVMTSNEFGIGSTSLLKQCPAQSSLVCVDWS